MYETVKNPKNILSQWNLQRNFYITRIILQIYSYSRKTCFYTRYW